MKSLIQEINQMKTLWGYDTSKTLNENLIKEFKGQTPDGATTSTSPNTSTGSQTTSRRRTGRQTTSQYKTCPDTFPIAKFCNNAKIKEIQVKLNMESKYQTGNFGPLTEKAILAKIPDFKVVNGITQDDYNKIMGTVQKTETPDDDLVDLKSNKTQSTSTNPDDDLSDAPAKNTQTTPGAVGED